jgi:hypothetical protein
MIRAALPAILLLVPVALSATHRGQDPPRDPPQDPPRERPNEVPEEELYFPDPFEAVLSFFLCKGGVDEERLAEALDDLDADAYVFDGPTAHHTRPQSEWIAVEHAPEVSEKDLLRAVKKGRAKVEPLRFTMIRWRRQEPPPSKGSGTLLKQILSLHSDIAWGELRGEYLTFFWTGNKLDGPEILARFQKLWSDRAVDPSVLKIEVVQDEIRWQLEGEVDEKAARKASLDIEKLLGVESVEIDAGARTIELSVRIDGLEVSAPRVGRRYVFDTNPVLAALEEHGLTAILE